MRDEKVRLDGIITFIQVAAEGEKLRPEGGLSDSFPDGFDALMFVNVPTEDGLGLGGNVAVGFNGDSSGLVKGSEITILGTVTGETLAGMTFSGAALEFPMIAAQFVEEL